MLNHRTRREVQCRSRDQDARFVGRRRPWSDEQLGRALNRRPRGIRPGPDPAGQEPHCTVEARPRAAPCANERIPGRRDDRVDQVAGAPAPECVEALRQLLDTRGGAAPRRSPAVGVGTAVGGPDGDDPGAVRGYGLPPGLEGIPAVRRQGHLADRPGGVEDEHPRCRRCASG